MNQTPAAVLVLAASVLSYSAHAASVTSRGQTSVVLVLVAIAVGLWGAVSLLAACVRERELLIDSHARLDTLDRVLVREPLNMLKNVVQPKPRVEKPRSLQISSELQTQLNALAQLEGRDRSEILEEALRQHLPQRAPKRAA